MQPYADTIFRLRHDFNSRELDAKILKLHPQIERSVLFLIKMEIKKLGKPMRRVIDLRNLFEDQCEAFTFDGVVHQLDKTGIEDFKAEAALYKGLFTTGVYEVVMERAKERHQTRKSSPHIRDAPPLEMSSLSRFFQRKEERLYYAVKVNVFRRMPADVSPIKLKAISISGLTTDISETGLSVKLPSAEQFEKGSSLYVWFSGAEQEYTFNSRAFVHYRVIKVDQQSHYSYVHLILADEQDQKSFGDFQVFVQKQLVSQKRRNRVPLENTIEAITVKANEQFVMGRMNVLPLFMSQIKQNWYVRGVLRGDNNTELSAYFTEEKELGIRGDILFHPQIQALLHSEQRFSRYLFILKLKSAKLGNSFALIVLDEIAGDNDAKAVIMASRGYGGARLLRVDGCVVDPERQAHVPSSLPDSAGEVFEQLNRPPSDRARKVAASIKRLVVLTDCSDLIEPMLESRTEAVAEDIPQGKRFSGVNISKYLLAKPKGQLNQLSSRIEVKDLRSEDRFFHSFPASVLLSRTFTESVPAITINVSSKGLMLRCKQTPEVKPGAEIRVSLKGVRNEQHVLQNLPYKVVRVNGQALHLTASGNVKEHEGRIALKNFIFRNLDTLRVDGVDGEVYGMSRIYRNLFAANHPMPYALMSKTDGNRYVKRVAVNGNTELPRLGLAETAEQDMAHLFVDDKFRTLLLHNINLVSHENPYQTFYCVCFVRKQNNSRSHLMVRSMSELDEMGGIRQVIDSLNGMGQARLLRVNVTKKGRVFSKYFKDELNYLTRYSSVKAEQILTDLREVIGGFDISDVSELARDWLDS